MVPLAILAVVLYASGLRLLRRIPRREWRTLSDEQMRQWIRDPSQATGELGEIIRYTQDGVSSIEESTHRFAEVEAARIPDVDRRLAAVNVLVAAAPLMGLLGTVLGMLVTFQAISTGGGKMVDMMARGISEALITTEMGLLIALPGMMLSFAIRRRRNEYVSLLARLECITLRYLRPRLHGMTRAFVRPAAGGSAAACRPAPRPRLEKPRSHSESAPPDDNHSRP